MKKNFLATVLVLSLIVGTTVCGFASETKTFKSVSEKTSVSISNIVKKDTTTISGLDEETAKMQNDIVYEAFEGEAPVVVTLLKDATVFDLYDMQVRNGKVDYTRDENGNEIQSKKAKFEGTYRSPAPDIEPNCITGSKYTITQPGIYLLSTGDARSDNCLVKYIIIPGKSTVNTATTTEKASDIVKTTMAKSTASTVIVNGKNVAFEAYNIGGNNYFKLRDLAQVVSGSKKQFEVGWDNTNKAINLLSGKTYTSVGGELAKGDGISKTATVSTATIYKDGAVVSLTAYTINGNNYFKLRDIAKAFNIGVTYDNATKNIGINTDSSYTE
ncbi:MAG: hypothetical protein E7222_07725 [Clostridiales bacterium]|nr:hypothetical protein [Clostridiales bacterium]